MDDGYKAVTGFYICTDSYSLEDNTFLATILSNKFNLDTSVHKTTNGHRLYISSKSKDKFIALMQPYIIPHFVYKINK